MTSQGSVREAVGMLRGVLARAKESSAEYREIVSAQSEVLARYQPVFSPEGTESLTEDEFRGFLLFKNNRHWWFPLFHVPRMCADMGRLRQALGILVDENRSVQERLDELLPKSGPPMVPYLGRAVITAILLVTHPHEYGVWNSTSEGALKELGVFPEFDRGAPFSQRYVAFNEVVNTLAQALSIDIWTVDALWWIVLTEEPPSPPPPPGETRFLLERYLHEFMRDNWDTISLGQEWDLREEDGELVGYEYPAGEVGQIDLLAQHKTEPRWLVIELKRGQSSDETVGQVLRYMGWVKRDLADTSDTVEGLIIAHSMDPRLHYALEYTSNLSVKLYKVDFRLTDPGERGQEAGR